MLRLKAPPKRRVFYFEWSKYVKIDVLVKAHLLVVHYHYLLTISLFWLLLLYLRVAVFVCRHYDSDTSPFAKWKALGPMITKFTQSLPSDPRDLPGIFWSFTTPKAKAPPLASPCCNDPANRLAGQSKGSCCWWPARRRPWVQMHFLTFSACWIVFTSFYIQVSAQSLFWMSIFTRCFVSFCLCFSPCRFSRHQLLRDELTGCQGGWVGLIACVVASEQHHASGTRKDQDIRSPKRCWCCANSARSEKKKTRRKCKSFELISKTPKKTSRATITCYYQWNQTSESSKNTCLCAVFPVVGFSRCGWSSAKQKCVSAYALDMCMYTCKRGEFELFPTRRTVGLLDF